MVFDESDEESDSLVKACREIIKEEEKKEQKSENDINDRKSDQFDSKRKIMRQKKN